MPKDIYCLLRNAFLWQIFSPFWDKWLAITTKKFHHFNSKNKTSRSVERYEGWLSVLGWDFRLSRILIFRYHFKTNGMLFPDKSFCFFEINPWPLPPKNFSILTQKNETSRRVERYRGYCQYYTVPWLYIHPFKYITMTNFSAILYNENWSFKFPIVSFFVKKDD